MMQGYVANQGDAWQFTLKALTEYYGRASQSGGPLSEDAPCAAAQAMRAGNTGLRPSNESAPISMRPALLGQRTAELHLALASDPEDPDFAPQLFSETDAQGFRQLRYSGS